MSVFRDPCRLTLHRGVTVQILNVSLSSLHRLYSYGLTHCKFLGPCYIKKSMETVRRGERPGVNEIVLLLKKFDLLKSQRKIENIRCLEQIIVMYLICHYSYSTDIL